MRLRGLNTIIYTVMALLLIETVGKKEQRHISILVIDIIHAVRLCNQNFYPFKQTHA